ncbi:MAG: hypothetical protein J0M07_03840 [Anaerolineae bacterium]|nr:hypothetical protein [Anaerolineae bacterium]
MADRPRFSEKASFVTGDLGNQLLKLMPIGMRTEMSAIRHSVVAFNDSEWETMKERYRYSPERYSNTFLFSFKGREEDPREYHFAVGDHAAQFGSQVKLQGEDKYEYKYWAGLLISQLLSLFPDGHSHVVMALAHPTRSVGQRDIMGLSTIGRHYVTLPSGKEVKFTVREMVPWDEPVGGLVRWSESLQATYNSLDLDEGSQVMVLDIGGGITSFTHVFVDRDKKKKKIVFNPVYEETTSPSFDLGIQSVMDRLRAELLKNVPQFAGMKRIPNSMLESGIRNGVIKVSNEPVNVSAQVKLAQTQLLDSISGMYANYMQSGRPYNAIICTGGGMYSMFETLKNQILAHKFVYSATGDELSNIHFANLQGGDEIFRQWIQREKTGDGA